MAWVKLDDQAPRNEKMLRAGPAACWLWVCGIAHSQSQLTDGFISSIALPLIGVRGVATAKRLAEQLVGAGLFDRVEGGYQVHDYLDHNPSRAAVLAKRAEDAERKRRGESTRNPDGIRTESSAPRARVPSHPIPTDPIRSGRIQPLRRLSRFVVFRWQVEKLMAMLGAAADAFDLDLWFDTLNTQAETAGVVIPDEWAFLKAATMAEAQRRGLAGARPEEPRMFKEPTQADVDLQLEMLRKADAQRERDRAS